MKIFIRLIRVTAVSGCLIFSNVRGQSVGINTINPQASFHVDGSKDNPNSGTPTSAQAANDVVFTSSGQIGVGTLTPAVKIDVRSTVNTDNAIAIGKTTQTASDAGEGAVRYSSFNGGKMQYSDGTVWQELISTPTKSVVVANLQVANFTVRIPYQTATGIQSWNEISDSANSFNSSAGTFTAPRTGVYLVSFTYNFVRVALASGYFSEARYVVNGNNTVKKCIKSYSNTSRQAQIAGSCLAGVALNKGDVLQPQIYQSVYNGDLSLRTDNTTSSPDYGFINLSIVEQ
ncbi:hypothetical protein [uncultured Chryseobacterium sp.]|uniref:hypothetical protein n=1 Tax=uncultured Chryseobacterium sp. TaxID=259322 RepID=UPI003748778A